MADRVRVLILEDNPDDAELAVIELRRAGLARLAPSSPPTSTTSIPTSKNF